jgi:hypothetical protein
MKAATKSISETRTQASRHSSLGSIALESCDTLEASRQFRIAGDLLKNAFKAIHGDAQEKNLLAFLAATQYFHGGHYSKAFKLASRIESKFLSIYHAQLLKDFLVDVRIRCQPDYSSKTKTRIANLFSEGSYSKALEITNENPFAFDRAFFAFAKGEFCYRLTDFPNAYNFLELAYAYFSDSKLQCETLGMMFRIALDCIAIGQFDIVSDYILKCQQQKLNPIFLLFGNIAEYSLIVSTNASSIITAKELLSSLEETIDRYSDSNDDASFPDANSFYALGATIAAGLAMKQNDKRKSLKLIERALQLDPMATYIIEYRELINNNESGPDVERFLNELIKSQPDRLIRNSFEVTSKSIMAL